MAAFNLLFLLSLACLAPSSVAFAPRAFSGTRVAPFRAGVTLRSSFDDYDQADPKQALAMNDVLVGSGDTAENGNLVTVAYKGSLMENGQEFDKSDDGISFKLGEGNVISGWEKGIEGMRVGGKRTLRIPPKLAYGDKGAGTAIPPGAHIQFECELLKVASNPIEQFFAVRDLEFPYVTLMVVAAAIVTKIGSGAIHF